MYMHTLTSQMNVIYFIFRTLNETLIKLTSAISKIDVFNFMNVIVLSLLKFKELTLLFLSNYYILQYFLLFVMITTKQSSRYWDREGYLLEVCGKTHSTHHELAMFLLDASTVRCVTASKRASRTRRFWTTCCIRRVMTSGFYPRFKVHWGPIPLPIKATTT